MPNITSFEILVEEIEKINGKPTVLEALWDGDTNGWFLMLSIYYTTGYLHLKEERAEHLGIVTFGGDVRLFTGAVPARPEAELAKEMGAKAAEKYGLTFYFPSDKDPDNACPPWSKRHLGIQCADCNKLIIPTDSPYLPKDICYNCHLEREHNTQLKDNTPDNDGVRMFLYKNGNCESAAYLGELIDKIAITGKNSIEVITADLADILEIRESLWVQIQVLLESYKKSDWAGEKRKFGAFETAIFDGKEYELECRFNHGHQEISSLIHKYDSTSKAISEGWEYRLFFKSGITYRDDSILRFIRFVSEGEAETAAIVERYKKALTATEVLETLKKLERIGLITIDGDIVTITETGKRIL